MPDFDISAAISAQLSKYSDEVMKDIKVILEEETDQLVKDISENSPKRNKKIKGRTLNAYSKGWTKKKVYENNLTVSFVVYNKTNYQLTHLLENPHATRDGGRVEGQPHIKPAEEAAQERILERIESTVSNK